jgi:hypothetical protein
MRNKLPIFVERERNKDMTLPEPDRTSSDPAVASVKLWGISRVRDVLGFQKLEIAGPIRLRAQVLIAGCFD